MKKQVQYRIKGMTQDLSISKINNEFSFYNYNIRLTARDNNTLLSITNERGNLPINTTSPDYKVIKTDSLYIPPDSPSFTTYGIALVEDNLNIPQDTKLTISYKLKTGNEKRESLEYHFETNSFYTEGALKDVVNFSDLEYFNIENPIIISKDGDVIFITTIVSITSEIIDIPDSILNNYLESLNANIKGVLLGYEVLDKYIILFTSDEDLDYITQIHFTSEGKFELKTLYQGDLNFSYKNPIETLGIIENENIKKVYWVDGLNQPRVIRIGDNVEYIKNSNTQFDFSRELNLKEIVKIERKDVGGKFQAGVIQYAFSYYNLFGQESNIFHTTPLYYTSFSDRGANAEEFTNNAFKITIDNLDRNFEYLRIYSIFRTSLDAIPSCRIVADLRVKSAYTEYTDTGEESETINPTLLLYIGGESIIASTLTQKDNTLFLGNLKLNKSLIPDSIKTKLRDINISFSNKTGINNKNIEVYDYNIRLNSNSNELKSLKYLEYYRFGIQCQFSNGKWSEPLYIKDAQVTTSPHRVTSSSNVTTSLVKGVCSIPSNIVNNLIDLGVKKIRGVIVYPKESERSILCQGIVNSTVFNVKDRKDNFPFSQASWFFRPLMPWNENEKIELGVNPDSLYRENEFIEDGTSNGVSEHTGLITILPKKGAFVPYKHYEPLKNNYERGAEIQTIVDKIEHISDFTKTDLENQIDLHSSEFFVDLSIVTLNSPEIDTYPENYTNLNNYKFRIVGLIPLTASSGDISLITSSSGFSDYKGNGVINVNKVLPFNTNLSINGHKILSAGPYWLDRPTHLKEHFTEGHSNYIPDDIAAFVVYPWHREGSLSNDNNDNDEYIRMAVLKSKIVSNIRFSAFTNFLDKEDIWTPKLGSSDIQLWNSDSTSIIKLNFNSSVVRGGSVVYSGNIDKILYPALKDETYQIDTPKYTVDNEKIEKVEINKKDGYPIIITYDKYLLGDNSVNYDKVIGGVPFPLKGVYGDKSGGDGGEPIYSVVTGTDPVRMKYKSTPHLVIALNRTTTTEYILPTTTKELVLNNGAVSSNPIINNDLGNSNFPYWHTSFNEYSISTYKAIQDTLNYKTGTRMYLGVDTILNPDNAFGYLFLGEIYKDVDINTIFGGNTEDSIIKNQWYPAGPSKSLVSNKSLIVEYLESDTFYQRYDCLKTYPWSNTDTNQIVDIVSFMCETRINLDGRYDRNRGNTSNLTANPDNFNKYNLVYSQQDNFFNYRTLDTKRFNVDKFPNSITWSKSKSMGEEIDTWANITMASTLDLDGDKGEITSLKTWNNEIYCFQERGLSNILFNSRVQVPTSDGVPIEITNGLKVEGKRYIDNNIGCNNKWSIVDSSKGIYFVDGITNGLYLFNGQINVLSDQLGFRQWINDKVNLDTWNPVDASAFISFIDKTNDDIYFVNKDNCLVYSELLGQFTSFMSYENVPAMFNFQDTFISFKDGRLYEQNTGEYNKFFGEYKPFYITYRVNPDGVTDKTFDNIEYRADFFNSTNKVDSSLSFNYIQAYNEYQDTGKVELNKVLGRPSILKKKFRIWRANIPRDINNIKGFKRDRIRNPWMYLTLGVDKKEILESNTRMEMHDLVVNYFE